MNPGKLNRHIKIVEPNSVSDNAGGFHNVATLVMTVWGNIRSVSGKERIEARQAQAEISHKVTIRYNPDVNHSQLVSFNGKIYHIQYIINIDDDNRYLELAVLGKE